MKGFVMIRQALNMSGLFIEGTEVFTQAHVVQSYYGFNVTKTEREPIDQVHGLLAAKRIQKANIHRFGEPGVFIAFIAGVFEILNAQTPKHLNRILKKNTAKDQAKYRLFQSLMNAYDINSDILLTPDLWQNAEYWEIFAGLFESGRYTEDQLIDDTMKWYSSAEQLNSLCKVRDLPESVVKIPSSLLNLIGHWPAAIIYTPAEVAEAIYLAEVKGVNCKIGHVDERVYDKYIMELMDTVHLRQPVDLRSRYLDPITVTPYIEKHKKNKELRIYFDDTPGEIEERIEDIGAEDYIFTLDPTRGEVLNPFVEKVLYAIEAAYAMNVAPVNVDGTLLESGMDLIRALQNKDIEIQYLKQALPELVYKYIIAPSKMN
ncbi:hypothetical protein GC175_01795 [bacterium]|nr:hypothetical protein [bacterium]